MNTERKWIGSQIGDEVTGAQKKKKVYDHSVQVQTSQAGPLINESDSLFQVTDFQAWIIFTGSRSPKLEVIWCK